MALGGLKGTLSLTGASVGATNALAGSVSVAIGDLVFVAFAQQTALTASGVTDNLGNTYTAINAGTDAGVVTGRAFYSRVTAAGTLTTVTVAATSSANDFAGIAAVIEGPVPVSPLNANPANGSNDTASPFTCPATGTLSMSHQLVLCCVMHDNNVALSATSPNLLAGQANRANAAVAIGYKLVAATTTTSPEFTGTNPAANVLISASFRADLLPALYTDTDSFFTPAVAATYALTAALFTDDDTFYAATVSSIYGLSPSLFTDDDTFFSPTVTPGAVALTPSLFSDGQTFPSATVAPGPVSLAPSLFSDDDSFPSATVAATYPVSPALFSDGATFFTPTVIPGVVDLAPSLFSDADVFHDPSVSASNTLEPPLLTNSAAFHSPTVEQTGGTVELLPGLLDDGDTFPAPTVSATYGLTPGLFSDSDSFFTPSLAASNNLAPALYVDADQFYSPALSGGILTVIPPIVENGNAFYQPTVAFVSIQQVRRGGTAKPWRDRVRFALHAPLLVNENEFPPPLVEAWPPEFDGDELDADLLMMAAQGYLNDAGA